MFDTIINLMSKIHFLVSSQTTCTKRELFYANLDLFHSQKQVDYALTYLTRLFDVPQWKLGVLSCSKGLVAGDLTIVSKSGEFSYSKEKFDTVPADLMEIKQYRSRAECILIVEKDTVFERLIDDRVFGYANLILITVSLNLKFGVLNFSKFF